MNNSITFDKVMKLREELYDLQVLTKRAELRFKEALGVFQKSASPELQEKLKARLAAQDEALKNEFRFLNTQRKRMTTEEILKYL